MKSIKLTVVGAAAAALILGAGCHSNSRDMERHEAVNGSQQGIQGTGGSGMDSSGTALPSTPPAPINDSDLHGSAVNDSAVHGSAISDSNAGLAGQDSTHPQSSTHHKRSSAIRKDSTLSSSQSGMSGSTAKSDSTLETKSSDSTVETKSSDSTMGSNDMGQVEHHTWSGSTAGTGGGGDVNSPASVDTGPASSSAVDTSSDVTSVPDTTSNLTNRSQRSRDGLLDNEAGSRTNITGPYLNPNTNPTSPSNSERVRGLNR